MTEVYINKRNIALIFLSIVLLFNIGRLFYTHYQKSTLKSDTLSYLTDQGYDTSSDIEDLSIVNIGLDETVYAVVVMFQDEPDVVYFYTYEEGTKQIKTN